jgi:hypothetical protein
MKKIVTKQLSLEKIWKFCTENRMYINRIIALKNLPNHWNQKSFFLCVCVWGGGGGGVFKKKFFFFFFYKKII